MANTQIAETPQGYGLDQLNAWIKEREKVLGPLIEIADGGHATAGRFNLDEPRVRSRFSKVSLKVGSRCVTQDDLTFVGEGEAYIADVLKPVCIWR